MKREWNAKAEIAETAEVSRSGRVSPGFENQVMDKVIGAAIEVHRHLGPGLLESAYEECLCFELSRAGVRYARQVPVSISYKGLRLESASKLDLLVEDAVIVELKTVDDLLPIHKAQILTYLKASNKRVGLLINFNVPILTNGLKRVANHFVEEPSLRDLSELCGSAVQKESH